MIARLFLALALVLASSVSLNAVTVCYVVNTDTVYANLNSIDKQNIDFYKQRFNYSIKVITDDSCGHVKWTGSEYSFIHRSNLADNNLLALADSAVAQISCRWNSDAQLKLAANDAGSSPPVHGDTQIYVKGLTGHPTTNYSMDTVEIGWGGGFQVAGLISKASGVQVPWNTTRWFGTDTIATAIAETGAQLTSGMAPARRAFWGVGHDCYEYATIPDCHYWEMFGNIVAWVANDTLNQTWVTTNCFVGKYEICALWREFGTSDCSMAYNAQLRFGLDPNVTGKCGWGLQFNKILEDALARKIRPAYNKAVSCSLKTYIVVAKQIDHATSGFSVRFDGYRVIGSPKWTGAPPFVASNPAINSYVTGIYRVATSSTWQDTNLVAGVDYDAARWDTIFVSDTTTVVGDTLFPTMNPAWIDLWLASPATNLGCIYRAPVAPSNNYCTATYCDVEISGTSGSYQDELPGTGGGGNGTYIWWLKTTTTSPSNPSPAPVRVTPWRQ